MSRAAIIDDGGPVYPWTRQIRCHGLVEDTENIPGTSFRADAAKHILAGLCANPGGPLQHNPMSGWGFCNCSPSDVVGLAVEMADELIAQLKKKGGQP
jgi:hypothetical protein